MKIFDNWRSWSEAKQPLMTVLPIDTLNSLEHAFTFASVYHGKQTRPNGEPYIIHLFEVVEILLAAGVRKKNVLLAGVLHDVVEDTSCSLQEVHIRFGENVANLVEWLTKPEPGRAESSAQLRVEYIDKFKIAPLDVVAIKLADRLSNVQKLDTHPKLEKQRSYYCETVEKIMPLSKDLPWFNVQFQLWKKKFRFLAKQSQN